MSAEQPVALTIAGSDPSGGAGLQADLKTFHQFGVYGEAVVTLATVQNTVCVSDVVCLDPDLVRRQVAAVSQDIPPDAAKTGALGSAEIVEVVAEWAAAGRTPLVVDPVMISKHGAPLLDGRAAEMLARKLLPYARLVTPNVPEAEELSGVRISSREDMLAAARRIAELGPRAVLIKGGHLDQAGRVFDLLLDADEVHEYSGRRIETRHTHGTGCVTAAAITAGLAVGKPLPDAVCEARDFVARAVATAPGFGGGYGPLNLFVPKRS